MKKIIILSILLFAFLSTHAQIIDIPDVNFKNALINTICADLEGSGILTDDVDTNNDGEIQVSEAEAVYVLAVNNQSIGSLEGIEYFSELLLLYCVGNQITNLDLTALTQLLELEIQDNELTSVIFPNAPLLDAIICDDNQLAEINLSTLPSLKLLDCSNNQLTDIDLSITSNLEILRCAGNAIEQLDFSNNPNIHEFSIHNNALTEINLKNGQVLQYPPVDGSVFGIGGNPDLAFICVDGGEIDDMQNLFGEDIVISSYCSFVPGGAFYTVEGSSSLDLNVDGCDSTDDVFTHLNLSITDGTETGNFISDSSGNYTIPVQDGTHTITPLLENPDYFSITPTEITVSFPTDTSPFIQDFCITPNGTFNDLEITIIPLELARPGFDTNYKLVYKNKGNTSLSGNINFAFEDDVTTFVSSTPPNESGVPDLLYWSFIDLTPFETGEIYLTMNLNAPTETPPLNDGDILTYNASIEYVGTEETPDDNMFELNQAVVNSFDPNDKTCLEGEFITPEMVGDYVHYMIRFENTGTANAINIVVKDIIDITKYEMSSLVPINASHDFVTRITNNVVEFIFEDINLPFDDANNDGYVVFKIKTLDTLVLDDTFENEAEIYFDFNFPIITNTAETTVGVLSVDDFEFDVNISIYPNPVENELFINSKDTIELISIYDLSGRLIREKSMIGNQIKTSISTEKLSSSVYFIKVKTTQNEFTKRVIKK